MTATPHPERTLSILGSTGSIGCSTLSLVAFAREDNPDAYPITALTAQRNVDALIEQARTFRPACAVIGEEALLPRLREGLDGTGVEAMGGHAALLEAAAMPSDWVMGAIVGAAGLEPMLVAARRGAVIALANKECLVSAGTLFMDIAARHEANILPVDSEHNAIFQVLEPERMGRVEKLVLTASGGPFRTWSRETMAAATPQQAVAHPNWSMGAKISVDSATLMNKGLELIEAAFLFDVGPERLDVLVHPQSIIHSMVTYDDGSTLAQLGAPDMRTPIAHTLAWPERMRACSERLDLARIATLTFEAPDYDRFLGPKLALASLEAGGGAPTVLNAANEMAVAAFLDGRIGFLDIPAIVADTCEAMAGEPSPASFEAVQELDHRARGEADRRLLRRAA